MKFLKTFSFFQGKYRFGIMHVGAPCCGMNAVVRSFVRSIMFQGFSVLGIHEGFEGLASGNVSKVMICCFKYKAFNYSRIFPQ